ncbi:MAG: TolC family protein [Bacteriovoracia bacterium]
MRLLLQTFIFMLVNSAYALELTNNLAVQSLKKEQEASEVKEGHLGRSFLPELSLVVGEEYFKVESVTSKTEPYGFLEARFNLFRGGKDNLASEIIQLRSGLSKIQTDLRAREELNKIRKLQYEIIFNNELISILDREKEENLKIRSQANRRASSGVATRTDSLEFTIYDSELEEKIESLKHENKILKIGLAPLVGIETKNLEFPLVLDHQHDEVLLARVENFQKHPQVVSLKLENEIFQKEKAINQRFWLPSVDVYGGHYYNFELINRDYRERNRLDAQAIGVRLTIELFDGLESSVEATSNQYRAEAKRLMSLYSERQSESKFSMLKEDLIHTHEVMHYVLDRIKKSKDYLRLTLKEYDRGVKNSLDALTAMQRYYRYEKDYLEKKKEYHVIKADLLTLLGE